LKAADQVGSVDVKSGRQAGHCVEARIPFSRFERPDVGASNARPMSEALLRQPKFVTASADSIAE
jgi:hypothetical protein